MQKAGNHRDHTHLFDVWDEVRERLHAARHVALFLDFDGSLEIGRASCRERVYVLV